MSRPVFASLRAVFTQSIEVYPVGREVVDGEVIAGLLPVASHFCFRSFIHLLNEASENLSRNPSQSPLIAAFCQIFFGCTIIRFGGVKSLLVISSVCLDTQSIIKSGNQAIRLFFTFTIFPILNGFLRSISIPSSVPEVPPAPIFTIGPAVRLRAHRLERLE